MRIISLIFIPIFLTSFQCQRLTNYTKDIKINSDPDPIKLQTDTVDFLVTIECNNEDLIKNKPTLVFYAIGDDRTEELSSIQLTKTGQISRRIKQKLSTSDKWKNIGVKSRTEDNTKYDSPILPIAVINDGR
jgi:hypothetical protein